MASTPSNFFYNMGRRVSEVGDMALEKARGLRDKAVGVYNDVKTADATGRPVSETLGQSERGLRGPATVEPRAVLNNTTPIEPVPSAPRPPAVTPGQAVENSFVRQANNQYVSGEKAPAYTSGSGAMGEGPNGPSSRPQSGLRKAIGTVGRVAAPLAAASGVPEQLQEGAADQDDALALNLGSPSEGKLGSAYRGVAGNAISLARRTGNALTSVPFTDISLRAGDRVFGAINDVATGQALGTTQYPAPAQRPAAPAAQQPTIRGAAPIVAAPQDRVQTTNAGPQTAEQLISGTAVPVEGSGAFKGGSRPAQTIRTAVAQPAGPGMEAAAYDRMRGATGGPSQGGPTQGAGIFGEIAALQGLRARDVAATRAQSVANTNANLASKNVDQKLVARGQDTNAAIAESDRKIRQAQLDRDLGKDNRANLEKSAEAYARTTVGNPTTDVLGRKDPKYDGTVEREKADTMRRIEHSVASRTDGKTVEKLSKPEQEQLFLLDRVRRKFAAGREDVVQQVRDFFGTKQFDSQNLYSYGPKTGPKGELLGADIATLPGGGGYVLKAQNGNTMTATRGVGGEWNIDGPNGPVDADIAALFRPHFEAAEKRAKGGK